MAWISRTWLVLTLCGFAKGHNTFYEGYDLSLSGYHLCTVTELVAVTNVVPSTVSRIHTRTCGGWLPWRMCKVSLYTTTFETQIVHIPKQVKKCCDNYEQLGSYCVLSLNRSAEFTAKPGQCPVHLNPAPGPAPGPCEWDTDCPGWQKCCPSDNLTQCVDPHTHVNVSWWLNVTVTVKVEYSLVNTSRGVYNHTRLLHSVVTGALNTTAVSVFPVLSWPAGPFTTSSTLLLGSTQSLSPADISNRLQPLLLNIEEVTAVDASDVDECIVPVLRECSPQASCNNTPGSYSCACPAGSIEQKPMRPGAQCGFPSDDPSSTSGERSNTTLISTGPLLNPAARPVVPTTLSSTSSSATPSPTPNNTLTSTTLLARSLSDGDSSVLKSSVYDVQTLQATVRLMNVLFTESLLRNDSEEFHNLSDRVINETVRSLPPDTLQLLLSGLVRVRVVGLTPGSVVVHLSLVFLPNSTRDIWALAVTLMESLQNSSQFSVDTDSTSITDVDECLQGRADCSPWASCTNTFGSFTCTCYSGFTDANPARAGRTCQARSNETASSSEQLVVPTPPQPSIFNTITGTQNSSVTPVTIATIISTFSAASPRVSSLLMGNTTITPFSSSSLTQAHIQSTTPELPSTSTWTVSPTTQAPTLFVSYTEAISVECRPGIITVSVGRDFLRLRRIPEASLYLGQPTCSLTEENSTHVLLTTTWDSCGAVVSQDNSQNTTVQLKLYNNFTYWTAAGEGGVAPTVRLEVPVICTYIKRLTISTGNDLSGAVDMFSDAVMGTGTFHVSVRLLNGTSPLPQNYTLSPKDEVIIEVRLNSTVPQIKVVINKCWANPSTNPSMPPIYVFLENSV
ncbi:uromodulin-like 1 isoform X2 [Brachyhypopomus gauderio]|uniref:uromodulin-like 1 isoform X2 n=1 Tax=Brachyhypopomus gauderio TaxID=698409 RepID=UPI00404136ED